MKSVEYETKLRHNFDALLREASQFYMSEGDVHKTLRRLTRHLEEERIPYALIGGMALAAHGWVRMTVDVAILMTRRGLAAFHERLVGRGYTPAFEGAHKTFRDTDTQVRIEIITAGEFPGDGKPKPVAFPDPTTASTEREGIRVVTLERLIELKLASGISAAHRLRDLADVQDLISALDLPQEMAERLHPSVLIKYRELWQSTQSTAGT